MTSRSPLHGPLAGAADLVVAHVEGRLSDGAPIGRTATVAEIAALLPPGVPASGRGLATAWTDFRRAVDANTVGLDSDRFLAFVPMAPSNAAIWMDAVVGASSYSAESWLEAAGAVAAENQVLAWMADLAGMPAGAGGCFMSGGSIGNLSALAVARDRRPGRRRVAVADTAHASIANALHLLGLEPLVVPTDDDARFTAVALREALGNTDPATVGTIVASAGSTNAGVIDDLTGLAEEAAALDAWFHVDGAYGGAGLLVPELRDSFEGLGRADSFIVDPHKWLFATSGSCALVYRDPALARVVHTQHGPYIDIIRADDGVDNPSDLGFQLTRRASGLPFWFSLMVHGSDAHAAGVRRGIELARFAARLVDTAPRASLVLEPTLSVVLFRRDGWGAAEWAAWARRLLDEQIAFVAPMTWRGEPVGRLVFLHPDTSEETVEQVVRSLD